jgi:hypothetical protein
MGWQQIVEMKVTRAVDEHGQELRQPEPFINPLSSLAVRRSNRRRGRGWDRSDLADGKPEDLRRLPVRLRLADKPSRTLKEISGLLTAEVETPPEPLLTIAGIARTEGRTFKGEDGLAIKVMEVKRLTSGQVNLQVEVTLPAHLALPNDVGFRGRRRFNRRLALASWSSSMGQLELTDAKGRPFRLERIDDRWTINDDNALIPILQLSFQPNREQGPPAKLIYSARRRMAVEVPFTLKDVPLP